MSETDREIAERVYLQLPDDATGFTAGDALVSAGREAERYEWVKSSLTASQMEAVADFILIRGELKISQGLTALIIRQKAAARRDLDRLKDRTPSGDKLGGGLR